MSYLAQTTRVSSLLIGDVNYTAEMMSWTCSDSSANRSGFVTTSGTLVLGQRPGASDLTDYSRTSIRRGTPVYLDMEHPDGTVYRHPRGLLYVVSTGYEIEAEELTIELGCRITLAQVMDDPSALLPLAPIPLNESQKTIQNIAAAFQTAGKILWQNNQGDLVSEVFFGQDRTGNVEPGKWVSVIGETALEVGLASTTGAIPDKIDVSYSVPLGLNEDNTGRVDTSEELSSYFVAYPAVYYERAPVGGIGDCDGDDCGGFGDDGAPIVPGTFPPSSLPSTLTRTTSNNGTTFLNFPSRNPGGCGNVPLPPVGSTPVPEYPEVPDDSTPPPASCDSGWITVSQPKYLAVRKLTTSISEYKSVAAQQSREYNRVQGPAIEVNGQYFADKYGYCRQLYGKACNPNGTCPMDGVDPILQSYSDKTFEYGLAGELVSTTQDFYRTTLSAANTEDWRSGIVNGVAQDFRELSLTEMYLHERRFVEYYKVGSINYERTTKYTSVASRGAGIAGGITILNAMAGIVTSSTRASSTNTAVGAAPDRLNAPTTSTTERLETIYVSDFGAYTSVPPEAGPFVLEESAPLPLLFETEQEIEEAIGVYSNYLKRMVFGQTRSMMIAEALRPEIVQDWKPNDPYRVADPRTGEVMAYRTDATVWGVSPSQSAMVTTGIFMGDSRGTLVGTGNNLVGNAQPNMDGTGEAPSTPAPIEAPPSIDGDIVAENFGADVNVLFRTEAKVNAYGFGGVVPIYRQTVEVRPQCNMMAFVTGLVVGPGDLVQTTGSGGIPLSANGSLVVSGATVIDANLFVDNNADPLS